MKNLKAVLIIMMCVSFAPQSKAQKNTITYEGEEYWINGFNVAWNKFGGDFGNHIWWGSMYDTTWFDNFFAQCNEYGTNVVRLWIHCDGRANPEFNADGSAKGFDTDFYIDLDDCFRRAKKHDIMIMPCMWSFDMCKDFTESAGPYAGRHEDLLKEDYKMKSYIDNVWTPLVKRYKDQCNLFAWEVCNEPEWSLDRTNPADSNWDYRSDYVVPIDRMQKLTGWMASVVHEHSNKMVTTGSAAMRWNSDAVHQGAVENYWSDEALKKATGGMKGAYLDFYQVHFYEYMIKMGWDPYDTTKPLSVWELDRPVIIGETPAAPGKTEVHPVPEAIELAYKNGYAGIMYWSYNGDDGVGKWDHFKGTLKKFAEKNPKLVNPAPCPCRKFKDEIANVEVSGSAKKTVLKWNAEDPMLLSAFNVEVEVDGEWKKIKRVKSKGESVSAYKTKVKPKGSKKLRIGQTDVYGYTSYTSPIDLNN